MVPLDDFLFGSASSFCTQPEMGENSENCNFEVTATVCAPAQRHGKAAVCCMSGFHWLGDFNMSKEPGYVHPGRLTWNLQITHLERKMIFQTSMIMFHVNLQGCMQFYTGGYILGCPPAQ